MLVKFGAGILGASGSIGGTTFARNAGGSYARQRTKPVNPNTPRQQTARAIISALVAEFGLTLTAAQRSAWAVYADAISVVNRLGESIKLSGYNHFIRSNSVILQCGGSMVADGPTDLTLPPADEGLTVAISEATQQMTIQFTEDGLWEAEDGGFLHVKMSQPVNPGRTFIGGPMRFAGALEGDTADPLTSPQTMAVPFPVAEGHKVCVECRIVRADGRVSAPFRTTVTVGA